MAVSQGAGTLCFVLLLCCWQETELRPRTMTPGSTTEMSFSSKHQDMPGVLGGHSRLRAWSGLAHTGPGQGPWVQLLEVERCGDSPSATDSSDPSNDEVTEARVGQEVQTVPQKGPLLRAGQLNPDLCLPPSALGPSTLDAGIDENYQAGGSENYHELLENLQFSSGTEDKISNDETSANANLHGAHSENYHGPQVSPESEESVFSKKKNSKNTQYENLSILDKILQNMERSSGNNFRKEQPRTSAQSRRPGSQ
ncbi:sperm acrosome-associated protein 7 [Sapajus apella]|uniref:Sperm acrosome-associated protein 7 n=1 Tax=Sapajus apella TaxID=9515 RepID=A0A6J3F9Z0_SAPAP|nr:sperm acrosome-associated protein 7 [Sapajus apella]